jgi:DNA polymerase III delta subunit
MAKRSSLTPFLVFYGEGGFFLDRDLLRVKGWGGREITQLDGNLVEESEIVSVCSAQSDSLRLVILDDAQKVKGTKSLTEYVENKDIRDISTILAVFIRGEKLPTVWANVGSKGKVVEHKALKTWDTNNEVVKWLSMEAGRLGIKLGKGIAEALFEHVGSDLYRLSSEMQKLALLVGEAGDVEAKHVRLTMSPSPVAEPWQVADAALNKDRIRAMNLLSILYKNQGDEVNVPVASSLMKQVEKLLLTRQMIDAGFSPEAVAGILGMHPFRCKTTLIPQARKHSVGSLIGTMAKLCKLDVDVKGASRSKRTLVELAVLSISG